MAAIATAVAAVVAAGTGLYMAFQGSDSPSYSSPVPSNMAIYDDDGNVSQETIWNAATQTYEQRSYPYGKAPDKPAAPTAPDTNSFNRVDENGNKTFDEAGYNAAKSKYDIDLNTYNTETLPQWEKDNVEWETKKKEYDDDKALTNKILKEKKTNLAMTWDERIAHYNDAADSFVKQQHDIVDPQFAKESQQVSETMNARGMTGSRADVDTKLGIDEAQKKSDTEIANNATMYKYSLANQELSNDLNVYNSVKSGQGADAALALQKQGAGIQGAVLGSQTQIAGAAAANNSAYQSWLSNYMTNQSRSQALMNTSSGLAYLYGYGKKAGWWTPASTNSGITNSTTGYEPSPTMG